MADSELFAEIREAQQLGERRVLATVADARGSTPRSPGAQLLLRPDGTFRGTIGGGCGEAEVIEMHASEVYRVYMLGFLPGFAYMGSVPPALEMPRLSFPRLKVPAGSIGIAGRQTGVYPMVAPGGWQLIGQTPL